MSSFLVAVDGDVTSGLFLVKKLKLVWFQCAQRGATADILILSQLAHG